MQKDVLWKVNFDVTDYLIMFVTIGLNRVLYLVNTQTNAIKLTAK